jgi:NitT/TauT family transport system substrate-binding protein
MKKVLQLTVFTKVIIVIILLGVVGAVCWFFGLFDSLFNNDKTSVLSVDQVSQNSITSESAIDGNENQETLSTNNTSTWRISIDEWIGWDTIVQANGGLKTTPDSEIGQRGLDVELVIINDATQSSNALIKGDLVGAGYTINRVAFLMDKFENSGTNVTMPFISNYSNGGDGIIAKNTINSVNDLIGKKVGIPRFSEAQTLVEWLIQKSDLTEEQVAQIQFVYFDTPDDVAKAFFGGNIDAGATWQPYLSQAQTTAGAHILFSTKTATNLILDGILFRQDFVDVNRESIAKFIDAVLASASGYGVNFDPIRSAMPLFALEDDATIKEMTETADLALYADNVTLLDGLAQNIFVDMSNVWNDVSTKMMASGNLDSPIVTHVNRTDIFDSSIVKTLADKYAGTAASEKPVITAETKQVAQEKPNTSALLQKKIIINFEPNSAIFLNPDEAMAALDEFVQIANALNGAVIQIEGNVADAGWSGTDDADVVLSEQRAKTVAKYLTQMGVDPNRFIVVGNGIKNPIAPNDTEANMAQNRRTDIYFKTVE